MRQEFAVCIVGASAIGGSMAVRLARSGTHVAIVARGEHAAAIRRDGLTLIAGDERQHAWVPCVEVSDLGAIDVAIVPVSSAPLAGMGADLTRLAMRARCIVFAMDGCLSAEQGIELALTDAWRGRLDPSGCLAAARHLSNVAAAVVDSANELIAPGVVRDVTPTRNAVVLGAPDAAPEETLEELAQSLRAGGYDASCTRDMRSAIWYFAIPGSDARAALSRSPRSRAQRAWMRRFSRGVPR